MTKLSKALKGAALAAILIAGQSLAHEFEAGSLEIEHPWSRATPAAAKVAAGYLTIENAGDATDRLVSATAEIAGRSEIQEMAVKARIMTMLPLENGVEVPAKGEAELAPSGIHLMFLDLKRSPKQGETFKGTLTFEKAGEVSVEFAVQPICAAEPDHGGSDHGHMKH